MLLMQINSRLLTNKVARRSVKNWTKTSSSHGAKVLKNPENTQI